MNSCRANGPAGRFSAQLQAARRWRYTLHAVLTITRLLDYWEKNGKVEKDKITATREFLKATS